MKTYGADPVGHGPDLAGSGLLKDRAYMRRLGETIAAANAADLREHLALSPGERMRRSLDLMMRGRGYARDDLRTDDDPARFYELAKQRGLYLG